MADRDRARHNENQQCLKAEMDLDRLKAEMERLKAEADAEAEARKLQHANEMERLKAHANEMERLKSQADAEVEARKLQHANEMERLKAHANGMERFKAQADAEAETRKLQHANEMECLKANANKMESLKAQADAEVEARKLQHANEMERLKAQADAEAEARKLQHANEMERLKSHANEMERLKSQADAEVEARKLQHANEMERLKANANKMERLKAQADAEAEARKLQHTNEIEHLKAHANKMERLQKEADTQTAKVQSRLDEISLGVLKNRWIFHSDKTLSQNHCNPKHHKPAIKEVQQVDFSKVNFDDKLWKETAFCSPPGPSIEIQSENDVVTFWKPKVEAIIRGLDLDEILKVIITRVVAGIECDMIIVNKASNIPLSPVEFKKTSAIEECTNQIFNVRKGQVYGQNLNQLDNNHLMGFKQLYGMISDGERWMLTSNGPFDIDETLYSMPDKHTQPKVLQTISPGTIDPFDERLKSKLCQNFKQTQENRNAVRTLYTSHIVHGIKGGEEVIKMLVLLVRLAVKSLMNYEPKSIHGLCPVRALCIMENRPETTAVHAVHAFTIKTFRLRVLQPGPLQKKTKTIYLVRYLGGGDNGDCCLALSETGTQCCVVKWFYPSSSMTSSADLALQEKNNWDKVYGNKLQCRLSYFSHDSACLIMPYMTPIRFSDRSSSLGMMKEAMQRFSNGCSILSESKTISLPNRFVHEDIKWRHFGYFQGKMYLLDLGHISEIKADDYTDDWIEAAITRLSNSMGDGTGIMTSQVDVCDQEEEQRVPIVSEQTCVQKPVPRENVKRQQRLPAQYPPQKKSRKGTNL